MQTAITIKKQIRFVKDKIEYISAIKNDIEELKNADIKFSDDEIRNSVCRLNFFAAMAGTSGLLDEFLGQYMHTLETLEKKN